MIFITQCLGWFVIAILRESGSCDDDVDYLSCLQCHANRLKCSDGAANYPLSSGSEPQCWTNTHWLCFRLDGPVKDNVCSSSGTYNVRHRAFPRT